MGLASASGSCPSAQALAGQQPSSPGAWRGVWGCTLLPAAVLVAPRLGCELVQGLHSRSGPDDSSNQTEAEGPTNSAEREVHPAFNPPDLAVPFQRQTAFCGVVFSAAIQHEDRNMKEKEQKGQR